MHADPYLIIFLAGGAALFAIAPAETSSKIELADSELAVRYAAEAARRGVPRLNAQEETDVRARAIEDEVLYREALRLGLDCDDPVVRQRLIQKMLFLAEDLGGASTPITDTELAAFYDRERARFEKPEQLRFIHIYFSSPAHPSLAEIARAHPNATDPPPLGDAFGRARAETATLDDIRKEFGDDTATALATAPLQEWAGPIRSRYGTHFIRLLERTPPQAPSFESAKSELRLAYLVERKQQAVATLMKQLHTRYEVALTTPPRMAAEVDE